MKFKISATIPVEQYANIMPEIETEALTYEQARDEAMSKLGDIWEQYGVVPLRVQGNRQKIDCFVGGSVYYDPLTHTYTNEAGEKYLSGSEYAKQFEKPFDKQKIAEAMAKKFNATASEIIDMWELKAETSRGFGTAMHKALELYGRYNGLAQQLDSKTALHDHPVIKEAVQSFYKGRENENAGYEVFVVDNKAKHAGQIDRLLTYPTGINKMACRVQDFKTNADITKSLPVYWKQLEFYARILEAAGYKVEGLDLFHWNGVWKTYNKETIRS